MITAFLSLMLAMGSSPIPTPDLPQPKSEPIYEIQSEREKVLSVAKLSLGWKEATGNNDGPEIDRILAVVGLKGTGSPWCAAFCVFCFEEARLGHKIPHSAWSPDLVRNPTWKNSRGEAPRQADIYGIYFQSKGRVAHVGIVEKWRGGVCVGIEGNTGQQADTGSEADREGGGVYRRWRPTMTIHSVKSYL